MDPSGLRHLHAHVVGTSASFGSGLVVVVVISQLDESRFGGSHVRMADRHPQPRRACLGCDGPLDEPCHHRYRFRARRA